MKTKRLLAMFTALLMILCLAACGDGGSANKYTYEGVSLALPEGFTVDENSATPIAYGPNYPDNTDNIWAKSPATALRRSRSAARTPLSITTASP